MDISIDEAKIIISAFMVKDMDSPLYSFEYDLCIKLAKYAGYSEEAIQYLEERKKTEC
jgi:hypothetical protein